MKFSRALVLVITRNCNVHCRYCFVEKADISMTQDVALTATSVFFQHVTPAEATIKLFGGEPLLEFPFIRRLIKDIRATYGKTRFVIPTSGTIMTEAAYRFFKDTRNVELMVNFNAFRRKYRRPGGWERTLEPFLRLPDAGITITVTPRAVDKFSTQFIKLAGMGFRKFKFLPAYYMAWSRAHIEMLRMEFALINEFLTKASNACTHFIIKNITARGSIPLFNSGFIIDCNGDVFFNNLFLSAHFSHLRDTLKKGNINAAEAITWDKTDDCQALIRQHLSDAVYSATMAVDQALSAFVLARRTHEAHRS